MKRTLTLAVTAVMAVGLVAGCGSKPSQTYTPPQSTAPQPTDKPVTLKIGQLPIVDGLPFWVAEKNGYYKQQGVNVELITFKSANERDAAIMGGQIDGMLADPIATTTLYASGTKVQMTAIDLGVTKEEGPIGIVAAPDSGITDISQLKGVEIAISNYSMMHYVTEKLLIDAGFKPEEIKFINMAAIPVRYESLLSSKIKAATLPDPLLTMASTQGAKPGKLLVSDVNAKQNYSQSVIDFSETAIKQKADGIKRFYIAYNQGIADIKAKPQDYMQLLTEKANLPAGAAMAFQNGVIPFSFAQAPNKEEVESVVQWLADKQVIKSKPTYEQLVNSSLLPAK
ncbi:MAG: putative thiamine biosynthesis protein [Firmicutes bacterium]|nr:putative thiamine biosynthesis protein [Bacillota bacterium]